MSGRTLCMLSIFFSFFSYKKCKMIVFHLNSLAHQIEVYNLNVKQFGSQMRPHTLWGLIWITIVCKGLQWSLQIRCWRARMLNYHTYMVVTQIEPFCDHYLVSNRAEVFPSLTFHVKTHYHKCKMSLRHYICIIHMS